jgi:hypothetical protein
MVLQNCFNILGPIYPFLIFQKNSTIENKCKRYSHIFFTYKVNLVV